MKEESEEFNDLNLDMGESNLGKYGRDKCTISSERILEPVIDQYQSNDIAEEHLGIIYKEEQKMDYSRTVSQFWPTFVFKKNYLFMNIL